MAALLDEREPLLGTVAAGLQTDIVIETAEATLTTQSIAILENPFRGLHAFTEADADNFFWSRN
ncbi:MAG: hypothetical protein GWP61_18025 [Chloroflexi bacterium]|jgi:hypothetical protein|nr:hypothetical protein [Chloroflexota bacterium]